MSPSRPPPDDAELMAWIDRRLPTDGQARVDADLTACPGGKAFAEHCQRQNKLLGQAFTPALEERIPERLRQAALGPGRTTGDQPDPIGQFGQSDPAHHADPPGAKATGSAAPAHRARAGPANHGRWQIAAAVILLLALGFAIGWTSRDRVFVANGGAPSGTGLSLNRAANVAHVAYAPEVRHPVEVGASEQAHLVAWLSKRLGTPLRVPDLGAHGYSLIGGRLLPDSSGAVAAQFMFESSKGARLTLFVRRDEQGSDTAFRFAQDKGVSTFYWLDRAYGYALSGEQPRELMLTLADSVYRQLNP